MKANVYAINGEAYTDVLKVATKKNLSQISQELGFSPTYLKNIRADGRVRKSTADLIELRYQIPVAPYIITEKKEEPKVDTDSCEFRQMMDQIEAIIFSYIFGGTK